MANNTTGTPWKLDTAAVIRTMPLKIKSMAWNPTGDGDDLLVTDNGDHEVWSYKALAGDASEQIEYRWPLEGTAGHTINGFNLVTIDSGTLRVWVA